MSKRKCFITAAASLTVAGCLVDQVPPQIAELRYTPDALHERICAPTAGACVTIGDVTWFIDHGYVFSLDERGIKHYRHQAQAIALVKYKDRTIALTRGGALRAFGVSQRGSEQWYDLATDVRGVAATCADLLTLGRGGDVRVFHAPDRHARWGLGPKKIEEIVSCGAYCETKYQTVVHVPEIDHRAVTFGPTPYVGVRTMINDGGRIKLTLDSGEVRFLE